MTDQSMTIAEASTAAKQAAFEPGAGIYPLLGQQLLQRRGRVVDLSRPIFEGMPQWYGHQKTFIPTNQDHETFREIYGTDPGFAARNLIMSEHCGTHVDAIYEYDPDGPRLDGMSLEFFWGEAVCLDVSEVSYQDPDPEGKGYATAAVIQRAEQQLEERGEAIKAGDIVLLWFDVGDRLFPSQAFAATYPGVNWEGAEYLARKGVVNIGTDCMGLDNTLDAQFSSHMVCKKYGIVNTESLTNLDKLLNRRFLFFGLPLNIREGTGSPTRAFAYLPDE
jgi:kynurenine formamidase